MRAFKDLLIKLEACEYAVVWAENKPIEEIVKTCHRGDWLLWLGQKLNLGIKPMTLAKARCAKTVIHLMKDQRSIDAVNLAERFGLTDEVTKDDLRAAANAAHAAAYATNAAANAADAAANAAHAAYAAANAAAKTKNQLQTADICREILGELIINAVNEELK